jgi:hypothetical protein
MATFSKKVMGKEVGDAKTYAKPHNMSGKATSIKNAGKYMSDPNNMNADESTPGGMPARRVSMGDPAREDVKTSGIKIRGTGAATKGVMARGPMA